MTHVDVLTVIKKKDFLQYLLTMKNGSNTRNPNKFSYIHYDDGHNTEK
jgi:hypothetical protein